MLPPTKKLSFRLTVTPSLAWKEWKQENKKERQLLEFYFKSSQGWGVRVNRGVCRLEIENEKMKELRRNLWPPPPPAPWKCLHCWCDKARKFRKGLIENNTNYNNYFKNIFVFICGEVEVPYQVDVSTFQ